MSAFLSIVAADDHPVILMGLTAALARFPQLRVVAQAHDGRELLQVLRHIDCQVVVTDYNMGGDPACDAMRLLTRLRKLQPRRAVVVCTMVDNPALLRAMQDAGVMGLVSKNDDLIHVDHAVMATARGVRYYSPGIAQDVRLGSSVQEAYGRLSVREREVIQLYARGMALSEIAKQLGSSIKTVSSQKTMALRKLGLARDTELFQYMRTQAISLVR